MMKPLGLEGKVGAPAIIRTNPLLRKYDAKFIRVFTNSAMTDAHPIIAQVVESFLPFTWRDVLGVVQERYADRADEVLEEFLSACAGALSNRILIYDIDTPRLNVRLERYAETVTGVLSGSCALFLASGGSIVTGHATTVWTRKMMIGTGSIEELVLNGGLGVLSPTCVPYVDIGPRRGRGSVITPNATKYQNVGRCDAFHPDKNVPLRALYDRAIQLNPRSRTLREEMHNIYNTYLDFRIGFITSRRGASR